MHIPVPYQNPFEHSLYHYPLLETLELSRRWFSPQHEVHIHSVPNTELSLSSNDSQTEHMSIPDGLPSNLHWHALQLHNVRIRFTTMAGGSSRIRELVLKNFTLTIANFSTFPSAFPLLEELTCMKISTSLTFWTANGDVNPVEFIVLDKLSKLRLGYWAKGLLRSITAPALEYLTIEEESTVNDPSEWVEVEVEEEKVAIPTFDLGPARIQR